MRAWTTLMAAKIRNVLVLYRALRAIDGAEFRFHQTILYNSIYRGDDQLLVNTHIYGVPAGRVRRSGTCARSPAARSRPRTWRASNGSGTPPSRCRELRR